jgi:hypothetical protein
MLDFGPPTGVKVSLLPTSVGPSEQENMRVHWDAPPRETGDWQRVVGTLDYNDIGGGSWRTYFRIETRGDVRYVHVMDVQPVKRTIEEPVEQTGWPASPQLT